jgi:predicted glycosyltransferase
MLILQQADSQPTRRHGRRGGGLTELRELLSQGPALPEAARQRLERLSERLARVQALGGEFTRVCFSPMASAALAVGPAGD